MRASRRSFLALTGAGATGLATAMPSVAADETVLPLMSSYVTGSDRHDAPALLPALAEGMALDLRREPDNRYDARAIAVRTLEGRTLGHLPRIQTEALANLMDAGFPVLARIARLSGRRGRPDIALSIAVLLPGAGKTGA